MKTIHVKRPFRLSRPDQDPVSFAPGFHQVEDKVAEHWFVKANSDDGPEQGSQDSELAAENARLKARVAELEAELGDSGDGDDGQGDGDGEDDGNDGDGHADDEIASWSAETIVGYLDEVPGDADQVERVENNRDKPRSTVLNAVKKARG